MHPFVKLLISTHAVVVISRTHKQTKDFTIRPLTGYTDGNGETNNNNNNFNNDVFILRR